MNNGTIYIVKNNINDKVYIGQTIQQVKKRWHQHLKDARKGKTNMLIHRAMNKYGIEHFHYEVLEENISIDDINEKELYYIKEYDSINKGYNMCPGGQKWRRKPINENVDIDEVINLYNQGLSTREISSIVDANDKYILNLLHRNNIEVRDKKCSLPDKTVVIDDKENKLREFREQGLSKYEIARRFNVNEKSVRRWLKQYNIV